MTMPRTRDLLRVAAKSVLLTIALWVLFLAISVRFAWPVYAPVFTIISIVPMTISSGSIPLTAIQRFLMVLSVSVTVIVLTFAAMPLVYARPSWSLRGLFGAVMLVP